MEVSPLGKYAAYSSNETGVHLLHTRDNLSGTGLGPAWSAWVRSEQPR